MTARCAAPGNVNKTVRRVVDGSAVVRGWAVDGAGNRDATGANVSWVWDTSPPDTLSVVVDTSDASVSTAWLPWANATALNSTAVSLLVSSSELASRFVVDVDGDGVGVTTVKKGWGESGGFLKPPNNSA